MASRLKRCREGVKFDVIIAGVRKLLRCTLSDLHTRRMEAARPYETPASIN